MTTKFKCRGRPELIRFPFFMDIKYDGWYASYNSQKTSLGLYSGSGKPIKNKLVKEINNELFSKMPIGTRLIGELVRGNGKLGANNKTSEPMKYVVFDATSLKGKTTQAIECISRKEQLIELMNKYSWDNIQLAQSFLIENKEDYKTKLSNLYKEGWEGTVLKNINERLISPRTGWVKVKRTRDIDLKIIHIANKKITATTKDGIGVTIKNPWPGKSEDILGKIVEVTHNDQRGGTLRHPRITRLRPDKTEPDPWHASKFVPEKSGLSLFE